MTPPSGLAELGRTPPSGIPSVRSARRGEERVPQATLEVNASVPLGDESGGPLPALEEPTPRATSARAARVVGSSAPPMLAPGSRRVSAGAPSSRTQPATRYRYVSTRPPAGTPADTRDSGASTTLSATPPQSADYLVDFVKLPQPSERLATQAIVASSEESAPPAGALESDDPAPRTVMVVPSSGSWRPELSLLPEARRGLRDELFPLALDGCLVVGVLATEGAECRARLCAEIALALAESGHPRVLVLDADFGRALMQRFLRVDVPARLSLSEQLAAPEPRHWTVLECTPSLHVLGQAAGVGSHSASPRAGALAACVATLRPCYDFIVIDGPLLDDVAACEALRPVVDGIVFSHGRYGPSEITRVNSMFPEKRISLVPAVG